MGPGSYQKPSNQSMFY